MQIILVLCFQKGTKNLPNLRASPSDPHVTTIFPCQSSPLDSHPIALELLSTRHLSRFTFLISDVTFFLCRLFHALVILVFLLIITVSLHFPVNVYYMYCMLRNFLIIILQR